MDFDEEDKPKVVTKTRKFAPCRPGKSKPKPKDAPLESVSKSGHDVDAKFPSPKVEPEVYGGSVKMEIDSKVNKEPEATEAELMDEEEEEEEDVVVREIDVFFNPSIEANTKVRVNPSTSQVEVDLSMDVHSRNYDSSSGSKLHLTKQTLTTTWKQPPTLDYAVGVLSNDKLHLNPVHAVAQLLPSFQYQNNRVQADQTPISEENWVSLNYQGPHSEFCSRYLNGMMANGNSSIDFNMSPEVYINSLCRGRNSVSKHSSKRFWASLPLEERVQKLLCQGPPLFQYSVLKSYAPDLSDEEFLRVVQQYAWLVQGLWTPKTRLLKLDGPVAACRDYVLMLFSKGSTIKCSVVKATGRKEKMETMLTVFAKERPLLKDWKLKEHTDVSFIKAYPEIAKEQAAFWKAMEEKLTSKITAFVKAMDEKLTSKITQAPRNAMDEKLTSKITQAPRKRKKK